jgi:hypothetical protein
LHLRNILIMKKIVMVLGLYALLTGCTAKLYEFDFQEVNTPGNSSLRAIHAVDEQQVRTYLYKGP